MSPTYWRSASGKVHSKVDGRSHEGDNLDQANLERIGSLAEVDLSALCRRCFPNPREALEGDPDDDTVEVRTGPDDVLVQG